MKYLFADEAGNLHFTPKSSKYFIVTAVSMNDFLPAVALLNLRHELAYEESSELWESGFHACEDKQPIRDRVYPIISQSDIRIDSVILDKSKTHKRIADDEHYFYQLAWHLLFKYIAKHCFPDGEKGLVIAGTLGTKQKKERFRKSIADVVGQHRHPTLIKTAFWPASSHPGIQLADYCCWAIQRWKESNDERSYVLVKSKIGSCYEPFS